MKSVVTVDSLVKQYQTAKTPSVKGISFDVKPGEFFTFLGPNGAGKTTTISILNTTLSKTSGQVTVAGYDLEKQASQVRSKIGVIFQNPSLDANLTAEENIRFHAVLYGVYRYAPTYSFMSSDYKKKVMELAAILGIEKQIHQPIKTFSGGMKRKLEIIRGLIHDPVILFLDEPSTGLDPESRRNLWSYLAEVREERGTTIFLTTHYLDEAEGADRVCIITEGTIAALETPQQLKRQLLTEKLIIDAKKSDRATLKAELQKLPVKISGPGPFTLELSSKISMQEIIKNLKTTLTQLQTQQPSLEEAYLAVIAKSEASVASEDRTQTV